LAATIALAALLSAGERASAAAAATASPVEHFDILEYRVLGNSVLPGRAVERAVYPFLGPGRDLDAIKQAVTSLEKAYRDAGYGTIFVDIPEQRIEDDGVVRLRVTEGRLDQVRVKGARYYSNRQILAALPALRVGTTPNLTALQQELTRLNAQTTDRTVTPILKAGAEPGTVDVDLAVRDTSPFHASVEADNQYTENTTPNRVGVAISDDNLWQLNHSLSLQFQTAPADTRDEEVAAATYIARSEDPASPFWAFSYVNNSSNVATIGTLGVLGRGNIYGARWVDPAENTETTSQSVTLGLDYKDFLEDVRLAGEGGDETPIQYLNWSAQYSGSWRTTGRTITVTSTVNFGVPGLVNQQDQFEARRYGALAGYYYLRSSAQVLQALPLQFALLARIGGQWSPDPLIDDEQFSLGGLDSVRGYLVAESLGDEAGTGTLELHTPQWGAQWGHTLNAFYGFVFGDWGITGLMKPLPEEARWTHLGSTGLGVRMDGGSGLQGTIDYALPLVTGPFTRRGDPRVDFSIHYGF